MKLLVCGGGTGGHIYPAIAVVNELMTMSVPASNILWIGTEGQMEEHLVPDAGIRLKTIAGGPIVGVSLRNRLQNAVQLAGSLFDANGIIATFKPDVLFMTGGYVNLPVALAAWLRRLNSVIYLPDIEPGSSIRFLTRFVRKVATTTSESGAYLPSDKMVVTGYPVRDEVRRALSMSQAEARAGFDLQPDRPTLFVFGGSRGAQSINQALTRFLPELLSEAQVIHISGTLTWEETSDFAGTLPPSLRRFYRPFPYLEEDMGAAFRAADLVLARAGASMLGESPAFGLASILVPYPYAWRYQKVNADYLASRGAAIRIDDEEMGEKLLPAIRSLLFNPERRQRMSQAASDLDNPDAARRLAKLLLSLEGNSHG